MQNTSIINNFTLVITVLQRLQMGYAFVVSEVK